MRPIPPVRSLLRTPESRFAGLSGFPYAPVYTDIGGLRIAHVEAGPENGPRVLLMHGEPTWSYLYRKMIPVLAAGGCRVIAPDLAGFGRSDKPAHRGDLSYFNHVQWMCAWMEALDLRGVTLFAQDWGSLISLRMVADMPERFDRVAIGNGGLPTGDETLSRAFMIWRAFARFSPWFPIGRIVASGCAQGLDPRDLAAYDAPFPGSRYKVAARAFPTFVPVRPDDPESERNRQAWQLLSAWRKPFLTLFSTRDPVTRGGEKYFERRVPGASGQPHRKIRGAGHFLQEDRGEEVAQCLLAWMQGRPMPE